MITAADLKTAKIFGSLNEGELLRLAKKAADVRLAADEWLIREGEIPWFYVLLEGRLQMAKNILGRQQDLHEYKYGIGDFFGEVPILLGTPSLVSLRAETACRVARFDRQQLHELIHDSAAASAMILHAKS
jgi:thioredoxin reductase (NADPH)